MKRGILGVVFPLALAVGAATSDVERSAIVIDGIAAKVNGESVTIADAMAEARRDPELAAGAAFRDVYRRAVESLVNRRLILKAAADAKLQLQDWVVENRVREIVKNGFGDDASKLRAALAEAHIPYDRWRNQVREDMIVQAMRYQMVERDIAVSPAALRAEYAVHPGRYRKGVRCDLAVTTQSPLDPAHPVVRELKDVDPETEFQGELVRLVKDAKVGESTGPVKVGGWTVEVIKKSESGGEPVPFPEAYADIASAVRAKAAQKAYEEWTARLRAEAAVEIRNLPGIE